jgi:carbon-monoxide dehydrogenase small subunit
MSTSWTPICMTVNGVDHNVTVPSMKRLLDVLRENLHLTGTKEGCGEGECGSCSIRMNGDLVNSCLVPVLQADGAHIQTVEGLAGDQEMHPLQQAFLRCGGAQCGICTPGMLMAASHLLASNPHPSVSEIREGLAGNLCRCTGFARIFESVIAAATQSGNSSEHSTHAR